MKKIILGIFASFVSLAFFFVGQVSAEVTVEIDGNGTSSQNSANVNITQTNTINSTNQANIQNDVNSQANTGGNSASNNTSGDTTIQTGDTNQNVSISNQANSSTINTSGCGGCTGQDINVQVSGNGSDSENSTNVDVKNETTINATNNANITNTVYVGANTGNNSAQNNNGDVSISTGNIVIHGSIENKANKTEIIIDPTNGTITVINSSNGTNSVNVIDISILNKLNITKIDEATINNLVEIFANTGDNYAGGNNGSVLIQTGDIDIEFGIINEVNEDKIAVGKPVFPPEEPGEPQPQPGVPAPSQPGPSAPGPAAPGPGPAPSVLAAQLPVTGPEHFLFLMLFWLAILAAGITLRRLSERGPPSFLLTIKK